LIQNKHFLLASLKRLLDAPIQIPRNSNGNPSPEKLAAAFLCGATSLNPSNTIKNPNFTAKKAFGGVKPPPNALKLPKMAALAPLPNNDGHRSSKKTAPWKAINKQNHTK
jgi:hypothetical protein